MQQYHSNAATNINIRTQLQSSQEAISSIAERFGISTTTARKWRNRDSMEDLSSRPKNINYSLDDVQQTLIVSIRQSTWLGLDDIHEMLLESCDRVSRSSVYRTLVRHELNKVPKEEREKAKKFKEYYPGFLHIDVTYLPKFEGQKLYLFVAIDRATRLMYYKVYDAKTSDNAEAFMEECLDFFPFRISHVLTDNGLEFTNKLLKSKKGKPCTKASKLDVVCEREDIKHRTTKPFTPQTNGMVERANGTIKNATILKTNYSNRVEMERALMMFLWTYNLYRRHGGLRRELNVKTPMDALEKWYSLKPELFTKHPNVFRQEIESIRKDNDADMLL